MQRLKHQRAPNTRRKKGTFVASGSLPRGGAEKWETTGGAYLPRRRSSSAGPRTLARKDPSSGGRPGPWTPARTCRRPLPGGRKGAGEGRGGPRACPQSAPRCPRRLARSFLPRRHYPTGRLLTSGPQAARRSGKARRRLRTRPHTTAFPDISGSSCHPWAPPSWARPLPALNSLIGRCFRP